MHRLRNLLGPLRVFDALSRARGVGRAAELLHISPGAVSQQLKQLELGLGLTLFQKEGRELVLTEVGKQLALRIGDAFDKIENALRDATESSEPKRLRLRVMPTFAIKWLVPRLTKFYALHGDLAIDIATVGRNDDVQLEHADFVVRRGVGDWPDVDFVHLFDDAFAPVCTPELASKISDPIHLLNENLLHSMMQPDAWSIWWQSTGTDAPMPQRRTMLANGALCLEAAADGLGVAMAQQAYAADDLKRGRLVVSINHVATTGEAYYLVCDRHKTELPHLKAFRSWIRAL